MSSFVTVQRNPVPTGHQLGKRTACRTPWRLTDVIDSGSSGREPLIMVWAALRESRFADAVRLSDAWAGGSYAPNPGFALTTMNRNLLAVYFVPGGRWGSERGKELVQLILEKHAWSKITPDALALTLGRYWSATLADEVPPGLVLLADLLLAETLLRLARPATADAAAVVEDELAKVPNHEPGAAIPGCLPLS